MYVIYYTFIKNLHYIYRSSCYKIKKYRSGISVSPFTQLRNQDFFVMGQQKAVKPNMGRNVPQRELKLEIELIQFVVSETALTLKPFCRLFCQYFPFHRRLSQERIVLLKDFSVSDGVSTTRKMGFRHDEFAENQEEMAQSRRENCLNQMMQTKVEIKKRNFICDRNKIRHFFLCFP